MADPLGVPRGKEVSMLVLLTSSTAKVSAAEEIPRTDPVFNLRFLFSAYGLFAALGFSDCRTSVSLVHLTRQPEQCAQQTFCNVSQLEEAASGVPFAFEDMKVNARRIQAMVALCKMIIQNTQSLAIEIHKGSRRAFIKPKLLALASATGSINHFFEC
jgi:hypothetical protein